MKSRAVLFLFLVLFLKDASSQNDGCEDCLPNYGSPSCNTDSPSGGRADGDTRPAYEEESEPEEADIITEENNLNTDNVIEENVIDNNESPPEHIAENITDEPPSVITTINNEEILDPPLPPIEPSIIIEENQENNTAEDPKDPEDPKDSSKGAILDFLEKKETEEEAAAAAAKEATKTAQVRDIDDPLSLSPPSSESDSDADEDLHSEIEHLRSILSSLQQVLLFVAAGTFSFIVLYTAFYINVLRKIYSRTTAAAAVCSISKKNK